MLFLINSQRLTCVQNLEPDLRQNSKPRLSQRQIEIKFKLKP